MCFKHAVCVNLLVIKVCDCKKTEYTFNVCKNATRLLIKCRTQYS